MKLQKMRLRAYTDKDFQKPLSGKPYVVMINPESIKWNKKIDYNTRQAPDTSTASQKYKSTPSVDLSFDFVIDCTGVVDSSRTDMEAEIAALEKIIYTYNGTIHRPNFVKIQWGKNMTFQSVLKSLDTTYTLFKPDGSPLRAKVSVSFGEYISPKKRGQQDKRSSPDLTHLVTTKEGDTLPQLSDKIYNSPDYYIQVARFNRLNKFRNLHSNKELVFPPITRK